MFVLFVLDRNAYSVRGVLFYSFDREMSEEYFYLEGNEHENPAHTR